MPCAAMAHSTKSMYLHEIIKLAEAERSNTRDASGLLNTLRAFPEDVKQSKDKIMHWRCHMSHCDCETVVTCECQTNFER